MREQEFFSSENVFVSNSRFVAFGQTYAMSGVTSVRAAEIKPSQLGPAFIAIIGLFALLVGFFGSGGSLILGIVLLALAGWLSSMQKPEYFVCLSISSGEVKAVKSSDREYIATIVQALNDCIVSRG